MKIGKMEGTPREIRDFCENNGLVIEDYLEKTEKPINRYLFIGPSCFYVASIILLATVPRLPLSWRNAIFLFGCCSSLGLAVPVQIRYRNIWATVLIILCGIAFMLVALGVMSPIELLDQAQKLQPE